MIFVIGSWPPSRKVLLDRVYLKAKNRCYGVTALILLQKTVLPPRQIRNTTFPNQFKDVTPLHRLSGNRERQEENTCVVCHAGKNLWHLDAPAGPVLIHEQCARFLPRPEPAEPSAAYRAVSAEPDGLACRVTIVEIPAKGLRYQRVFAHLLLKPPAYIPEDRWQQCIDDGKRFLHQWGSQAEAMGWTSADLFGLHIPPAKPHPSYSRLSRYDCTGLCWLLMGCHVVALTEATASIKTPDTGSISTYRKCNKPALGPLGDSLDDFDG